MSTFTAKSPPEKRNSNPSNEHPPSPVRFGTRTSVAPALAFVDTRPAAIVQRRLQQSIDDSPRQVEQRQHLGGVFGMPVQRQDGLDEEELQMQADSGTVQGQGLEEEELLQGKMEPVQRQGPEDEDLLQGRVASSEPPAQSLGGGDAGENRTGMPDQLKSGLEQLSGLSLSGVRVHHDSPKPAQLNALAYAQGQDIHLGPGQEQHLPHEGWHAVQQMQGRVKPTMKAEGVSINDDAGLEHEADMMGAKALSEKLP